MSESRDEIRRDIEERRESMRANLDAIEERVRSAADVPQRALDHPLPLFGASVATGFLLGRLTGHRRHRHHVVVQERSGGWLQTAATALVVDLLYDAARNAAPRLWSRIGHSSNGVRFVTYRKEAYPMASTPKDHMIAWLKDAHSLERNVIKTLERHIDAAKDHPHMQTQLRQHLEESRRHAGLVEGCLKRYGESTSGLKEAVGQIAGMVQGVASGAASDTLVKNALGDYAAEHFEIASYTSLKTAAEFLGDNETAQVCEQILKDEQRMAKWLEEQISLVTKEQLGLQAHQAGR